MCPWLQIDWSLEKSAVTEASANVLAKKEADEKDCEWAFGVPLQQRRFSSSWQKNTALVMPRLKDYLPTSPPTENKIFHH